MQFASHWRILADYYLEEIVFVACPFLFNLHVNLLLRSAHEASAHIEF